MKAMYTSVVEVTLVHEKPILDVTDLIANRAYSLDGAVDCTSVLVRQTRKGEQDIGLMNPVITELQGDLLNEVVKFVLDPSQVATPDYCAYRGGHYEGSKLQLTQRIELGLGSFDVDVPGTFLTYAARSFNDSIHDNNWVEHPLPFVAVCHAFLREHFRSDSLPASFIADFNAHHHKGA